MKTTVDIPDALFRRLGERAASQGTTIRALIQEALEQFLGNPRGGTARFTLRDGSFGGTGPAAGAREGAWRDMLEITYEGRGGSDRSGA